MPARHGRPRPPGVAGLLRVPPVGHDQRRHLQCHGAQQQVAGQQQPLQTQAPPPADRGAAVTVIVAVTAVVVGHLILGWNWSRAWMVTVVAAGTVILSLVVLPVPHPVLWFLFAVLAKASLDPVGLRAGVLCGGALLAYLVTVVLLGVVHQWHAGTWWIMLAPAPGMAVLVALLRLYVDALAQRDDAVSRLELSARRDPLTGAASRDHFVAQLSHATTDPAPSARPAVLMVDLDRFKAVNDTYGHRVGDELLRAVATRLEDVVGPDGLVARLGGDEFAILLPDTTSARARHLLARLHERLASPAVVAGIPLRLGASIGVAIRERGEDVTASTLLHRADLDMYVTKRRGQGFEGAPTSTWSARRRTHASVITPHPERN